jgi:hypothetical protein
MNYPEPIHRGLRDLAGIAYERELVAALETLALDVDRWRDGAIDPWELSGAIHDFYLGPNRELFDKYANSAFPDLLVVAALNRGILSNDEIADDLLPYLEEAMEVMADEGLDGFDDEELDDEDLDETEEQ